MSNQVKAVQADQHDTAGSRRVSTHPGWDATDSWDATHRGNGAYAPTYPPVSTSVPWAARRRRRSRARVLLARYGQRPLIAVDICFFGVGACLAAGPVLPRLFVLALLVLVYAQAGLYRSRLTLSFLADLPVLVGRAAVATSVVGLGLAVSSRPSQLDELVLGAIAGTAMVCLGRLAAYQIVRHARASGLVGHATVILGGGRVGARLADTLLEHPDYGLRPVGIVDPSPLVRDGLPVPLLGSPEDLPELLIRNRIRVVIVAYSSVREPRLVELVRTCHRLRCEIFFVPRLFELTSSGSHADDVWGMPLVRLRRSVHRTLAWRMKRVFDVAVAATLLVLLAPVLLLCAAAARWENGQVLFRQQRIGLDSQAFDLLKFMSLRPRDDDDSQTTWNVSHDDRLGPVSRLMRKLSLDELPQLWNVLRGDMTLVGPRPERPHFVDQFSRHHPGYPARHRVPAGMTGWAQVHGLRGDTSISDRADFDNRYIENWSLWTDLTIILRTVGAVFRGSGA